MEKDNNNVTMFPGQTFLDIPPDRVLDAAKDLNLQCAIVVGRDAEGRLYLASSSGDAAEMLLLLELSKREVLEDIFYA